MVAPSTPGLTAEKVASYLPLSGHRPDIQGRIINVTHQIPYNILRSPAFSSKLAPPSPPYSPQHAAQDAPEPVADAYVQPMEMVANKESDDPVLAAPISKLARHHRRDGTLRVKFYAADWTVVERRGHAPLYAGLQSLNKNWETIHIGWTGLIHVKNSKKTIDAEHIADNDRHALGKLLWDTGRIVPIFLDKKSRGHYEGYCKEVLWPLFHYIVWTTPTDGRAEKRHWKDYVAVNQQFADTIIANYKQGDIICIHDYHLLLVPEMIRRRIPDAAIGLFVHATFPSSEIFRCLSTRNEILQGVLGADVVGFQTYAYSRHFISSCTRVLGCESTVTGVNYNGHFVSVGAFPIGIDAKRVDRFRQQPTVPHKIKAIRDMYAGKKIIVGRDKLDSTKGVLQKLHAFEKFLQNYPEWKNNVVLVQVTTPTFGDHGKLENRISETVSHINSLYGSLEFAPVHYYHQDIDRDEYYALLSVADVGLITSVRDGMNTTSFEYIICQNDKHAPLILSEFTGTAGSLSAAILVNPWHYAEVAKAIHDALVMSSEEKAERHAKLYSHVTNHTAEFWANSFVTHLVSETQQSSLKSRFTPALDVNTLVTAYKNANKRLMFFDYDGTLTPIVPVPSGATPSKEMLESLQTLCNDKRNQVWVVSGRDQATLDEWLGGIKHLGLSAEHGCYIKPPDMSEWTSIVDDIDMAWKHEVTEIFDFYTERTQGSFVEHKRSSITWHYRLADAEYGAFQAKECQNHLENAIVSKRPVEILVGKKNLEVRPMAINKGEIVKRVLAQNSDADLIICAGDDKTDEDMFRLLSTVHFAAQANNQSTPKTSRVRSTSLAMTSPVLNLWSGTNPALFSITVGSPEKKTMANWHVRTSLEIVGCLKQMAAVHTTNT